MVSERNFVEMVEKYIADAIAEERFIAAQTDPKVADRLSLESASRRSMMRLKLAGLYGMTLQEGMSLGRESLLAEQEEERQKKARARARKKKRAS